MACPSEYTLNEYCQGHLTGGDATCVKSHLELCSECRAVADEDFAGAADRTGVTEAVCQEVAGAQPLRRILSGVDHTDEQRAGPLAADRFPVLATLAGGRQLRRGELVGRFMLMNLLGQGGMAVVLAAYDPNLDRKVALKLVRPGPSGVAAAGSTARLLREARAMARVSHPNVVAVHDTGSYEDQVFVAMEHIDGHTLTEWLAAGRRSTDEILRACVDAARGLWAAHRAGLLHRDFKPANIMVGIDGRVRVMDFGLARALSRAITDDGARSAPTTKPALDSLTHSGTIMGTPGYIAPEQLDGHDVDERSDQFSFCATAYEALYGDRPFAGDTPEQLALAMTTGRVRDPPKHTRVPAWIRSVLLRGLSPEPRDRYVSMAALIDDLQGRPARRTRWAHWGVPVAFSALAAASGVLGAVVAIPARERENACEVEADRLVAETWDGGRRAELEHALRANSRGCNTSDIKAVGAILEDYVANKARDYRDTCTAARVAAGHAQSLAALRKECVKRQLLDAQKIIISLRLQCRCNSMFYHPVSVIRDFAESRSRASCDTPAATGTREDPADANVASRSGFPPHKAGMYDQFHWAPTKPH